MSFQIRISGAEPIAYYAVAVRHIPNKCQVKATDADLSCNVTGLQAETTCEMAGMACLEEGSACGGVFLLSATTAPHREFICSNNNLNWLAARCQLTAITASNSFVYE